MSKLLALFLQTLVVLISALPLYQPATAYAAECSVNTGAFTAAVQTSATASIPKSSYTAEDLKISVKFDMTTLPSYRYRLLVTTGGIPPKGGFADQEIDADDKYAAGIDTIEFTIPGAKFDRADQYTVKLQTTSGENATGSTACDLGTIMIFNKNLADLGRQCSITMSNNYKQGDPMNGSIYIPDDPTVVFNFEIFKDDDGSIASQIPSTPTAGFPFSVQPILEISTPNTADNTILLQKTLVPGKSNILQGDNLKKLGFGKYTAMIRVVAEGSTLDPRSGSHFICISKKFQVSRNETSEQTPGTTQLAPGATLDDARNIHIATKSCDPGDPTNPKTGNPLCTLSKAQPCPDGSEGIMTAIGCVPTEPKALVEGLIKFSSLAGGGIAFLIMILASLQFITAEGNPESVKHAQEKFYSGIIGLLFIIFSLLLMQVIGFDILGLNSFGK